MRRAALSMALGFCVAIGGCRRGHPASEAECALLLDRMVDLELEERGFHDPALAAHWHAQARTRFREDLAACRGRALPPGALDCLGKAHSAERAAHDCFR